MPLKNATNPRRWPQSNGNIENSLAATSTGTPSRLESGSESWMWHSRNSNRPLETNISRRRLRLKAENAANAAKERKN